MTEKLSIDDQIAFFEKQIDQQQQKVDAAVAANNNPWITNLSYQIDRSTVITVSTANISSLKTLLTDLMNKSKMDVEVSELLGVPVETKFNGYSVQDWITDCQKRIAVITLSDKQSKLKTMKQKLETLMSPEVRRQKAFESLAAEMSDLCN